MFNQKIGINNIGVYIPDMFIDNHTRITEFAFDESFLKNKIGIDCVRRKNTDDDTSDLCVKAYENLMTKTDIESSAIDCIVVVTQNPDIDGLPHTSSIVHKKLGLSESCAAFDVSLGCSGYVYALSIIESFMIMNDLITGLLFTADPYSKIVDPSDKNTSLLFGDAASVTLINRQPVFSSQKYKFGTRGEGGDALVSKGRKLSMDGRAVFNFSAIEVPKQILSLLEESSMGVEDIDYFLLHQGSKYIVDTIASRLKVDKEKVPFNISNIGNTVSSSLPLLLNEYISAKSGTRILMSGFGVGLSWASVIINKI